MRINSSMADDNEPPNPANSNAPDGADFARVIAEAISSQIKEKLPAKKLNDIKKSERDTFTLSIESVTVIVNVIVMPERKPVPPVTADPVVPTNPFSVLRAGIDAVPAVRYALGLAGIAAAGAIIATLIAGYSKTTVLVLGFLLAGMFLLYVFASLVTRPTDAQRFSSERLAGQLLMWAVTVVMIFFMGMTATAAAAWWPCPWALTLGFVTECSQTPPPPDPTPSEERQAAEDRLLKAINELLASTERYGR